MTRRSNKRHQSGHSDQFARVRTIFFAIMAVVALCGLADATYLTVAHLSGETSLCGSSPGCSIVLSSPYASLRGIPTAAFGMAGYFAAFSMATLLAFGYARLRPVLGLIVVIMFAATLWFLYVQAFILHAFCPFCLLSAALTFMLTGLVMATPPAHSNLKTTS